MRTYRAQRGDAPQFTRTADIPSPHRLQSSVTDSLFVPTVRLSTVGRRAFLVAGARIWNDLPSDVTSSPSLFTFKQRLKMHLFCTYYVTRTRDYHLLTVSPLHLLCGPCSSCLLL